MSLASRNLLGHNLERVLGDKSLILLHSIAHIAIGYVNQEIFAWPSTKFGIEVLSTG